MRMMRMPKRHWRREDKAIEFVMGTKETRKEGKKRVAKLLSSVSVNDQQGCEFYCPLNSLFILDHQNCLQSLCP